MSLYSSFHHNAAGSPQESVIPAILIKHLRRVKSHKALERSGSPKLYQALKTGYLTPKSTVSHSPMSPSSPEPCYTSFTGQNSQLTYFPYLRIPKAGKLQDKADIQEQRMDGELNKVSRANSHDRKVIYREYAGKKDQWITDFHSIYTYKRSAMASNIAKDKAMFASDDLMSNTEAKSLVLRLKQNRRRG